MVGLLYALVSAYWAAGGDTGLDELGGKLAELARKRDPMFIGLIWVTAVLKVAGATLGLALVQPGGGGFTDGCCSPHPGVPQPSWSCGAQLKSSRCFCFS